MREMLHINNFDWSLSPDISLSYQSSRSSGPDYSPVDGRGARVFLTWPGHGIALSSGVLGGGVELIHVCTILLQWLGSRTYSKERHYCITLWPDGCIKKCWCLILMAEKSKSDFLYLKKLTFSKKINRLFVAITA